MSFVIKHIIKCIERGITEDVQVVGLFIEKFRYDVFKNRIIMIPMDDSINDGYHYILRRTMFNLHNDLSKVDTACSKCNGCMCLEKIKQQHPDNFQFTKNICKKILEIACQIDKSVREKSKNKFLTERIIRPASRNNKNI